MSRIGLIDVDGGKTFPNLALMKISAWYKSKGHEVMWYTPFDGHFDEVYMSKVFSFTPDYDYVREVGLWAYVMIYDKEHCDPIYKKLSRWVNNRFVFAKCERFEDYTRKKTETENDPKLWD